MVEQTTATGGWHYLYSSFKSDEERRLERIALGIIPADEPEAETIKEASKLPPIVARRRLRQTVNDVARIDELEAMLEGLMKARREAHEQAYAAMLLELTLERELLKDFNRNQNASAVLAMLGLL